MHLFDDRQARKLLRCLHRLSKADSPVVDSKFKHAATLTVKHQDALLDYFDSESYADYLENNEERISIIHNLIIALFEPYKRSQKKESIGVTINNLRHLRNRYAHELTTPPDSLKGFSRELKSGKYTIADWADFILSALSEMVEDDDINSLNPMLVHNTPDELIDCAAMTSQKLEHHRTDVESTLAFLNEEDEWNVYTEVYDTSKRVAIQRLTELLDPEKPNQVVQICGEGGLGKTALMREYIRRNVRLSDPEDLYDRYLLFSSKSTTQGEVKTTPSASLGFETVDPSYRGEGPVRYVENLAFLEFLRLIAIYARTSESEEDVQLALEQNKFLVVLDNFEDCSPKDRGRFIRFFDSLRAGCRSKIIITGRTEASADDLPTIRLDYMSSKSASKLLWERYLFLLKFHHEKGVWEHRERVYTALQHLRNNDVDFINDLTSELEAKPARRGSLDPAVFRDRIGHPLVVLRLAVEIGRPALDLGLSEEMDEAERVIATLIAIARSNGFQSWQKNVSKWVTDKAYEDIENDRECVLILKRLLHSSASMAELKQHVNEQKGDPGRVSEATRRLLSHQILIRKRNSDDRYEAAEQAKAHLAPGKSEADASEGLPTTSVADVIEKQLDAVLAELTDTTSAMPSEDAVGLVTKAEVPLHKRVSITRQSLVLIHAILSRTPTDHPEYLRQMVDAFGLLAASMLQKNQQERGLLTKILVRTLHLTPINSASFMAHLSILQMDDFSELDQHTKDMFAQRLVQFIEHADQTVKLDVPLLLNALGGCGARFTLLISDMKKAWECLKVHPETLPNLAAQELESLPSPEVSPDGRGILSRMAQNDLGWFETSASLLCWYQAEQLPETWEAVHEWERYAVPPHEPPSSLMERLEIIGEFSPGKNGLSYAGSTDKLHQFVVVERPIVHPSPERTMPQASIEDKARKPHPTQNELQSPFGIDENLQSLNAKVEAWFLEQLDERPNGFHATALMTYLSREYKQRPTDLIPRISGGKYTTWIEWFESEILTLPRFRAFHLTRPTGTHVVIAPRKLPTGVRTWLFHAGPLSPQLPQPYRTARILLFDHYGLHSPAFYRDNAHFLRLLREAKGSLGVQRFEVHIARELLEFLVRKQANLADLNDSDREEIRTIFEEWLKKVLHIYDDLDRNHVASETKKREAEKRKRVLERPEKRKQKSDYSDMLRRLTTRRRTPIARRFLEEE